MVITVKELNKTKEQLVEELKRLRRRVSELEKSEAVHKRQEELLHLFYINSPIGMFVIVDHKFVFANKTFIRVTGITEDNLLGTNSLERVCAEDREAVRENATRMLRGDINSPYRYRIINREGQIRWMLESVVSIQYQGKRAVLGHSVDITDTIVGEEKQKQLYENEKKLRKELEAEVQKRIEYTRALVHELKTPLTPVLFSSELLVGELHEEPWASIAQNIHRGAINLNKRVDELLDLARVEIGTLQLNPNMIDPQRLLNNIANEVGPLTAKNKQHLVREIPTTLPRLWADSGRLRQVILNLLVNATKFTHEGGTITLAALVKNNSLRVEIRDTGIGISRSDQKELFQPYHQGTHDRERLGGLGLGLALSKNLVELHGGRIWVESKPGQGSNFIFTVPLRPPVQPAERKVKEQSGEAAGN